MTTTEAASLLGCSAQHVRHLVRIGKIRARRQRSRHNQHGYEFAITANEVGRYAKKRFPRGRPRGSTLIEVEID